MGLHDVNVFLQKSRFRRWQEASNSFGGRKIVVVQEDWVILS